MPDERMQCSSNRCEATLHKDCSEQYDGSCPRHVCFYCKRGASFHRLKHLMPACTQCFLQTNRMAEPVDPSKTMISCSIWPSTSEGAGLAHGIEEAFRQLPLPYTDREFNIDPIKTEELESLTKPPTYVLLKRNVYIVKHKCDGDAIEGGCTDCDPPLACKTMCSCRSVWISCSRACKCSNECTNRPFRREKRIEVVKTQHCGWGVVALESIQKGDFVIEFVGEVIDDVTCEERLEDMKRRGDQNFYMCKVNKNFVIDATFRGNACRFLNHSCEPNCQLEKWQVNGKTRLGVFASQAIEVGKPLTYSYRFKQHFGPRMECLCGAANCQGKL
ncbi:histone-lysine N-methyltransferase ASHR3 [Brachypodium distachyon]|uniref:SET domain-containing protein n=1 Tax=Brachypodium distachyon TaxID=15368 RepID=A0A0Q3ID66_BRADI|nr:histone-lysine N-methyltransferase ASHR3 [Brachypodium distachyon]KQJ98371.2 hypothetical protein BRADI_3g36788v3 [Brachypodium distachyon]|eukprot:XP_010235159.2 histone-lysine N-methyltransferase ASHR3 [Brachypodium distachyon]